MLMDNGYKPTKAHMVYAEILRRKDLIEKDTYRTDPTVRETVIKLDDIMLIMYRLDGWMPFPLIFFSDMKYNYIQNEKFIKIVSKYVRLK
jgi:hypothetical protein